MEPVETPVVVVELQLVPEMWVVVVEVEQQILVDVEIWVVQNQKAEGGPEAADQRLSV